MGASRGYEAVSPSRLFSSREGRLDDASMVR
jgi:hypothetical protein